MTAKIHFFRFFSIKKKRMKEKSSIRAAAYCLYKPLLPA